MIFDYKPERVELATELGKIDGLFFKELNVTQYHGIPYATVPGRFRKSVLRGKWTNDYHDGTKLGPMIPQIKRSFYPIPLFDRPWLNIPDVDENGLNLNISVPTSSTKMPVMIFIHGGANTYGAGNACIYDGLQLAAISDSCKEPTIIISFNYRLGAFGFLASNDLKQYNKSFGETGVGNYGLSDQENVLIWVNRFISNFGGDPLRVTLFGQSAGSQATHIALLKDKKLFNRAILQSGLSPLCGIFSIQQYDVVYFKLLEKLNIDANLSPEERVKCLLDVDYATLTQANEDLFGIQFVTMAYTEDDEILPKIPSWSEVDKKISNSFDSVMIGDCRNECIIWNSSYKDFSASEFIESMYQKCKSKEIADTFMSLYGINSTLDKKELFKKIESMTTDGMYLLPNYLFYNSNPNSLVYHFDQESAYDNEWNGYAHHSLDNAYIWGSLKRSFPQELWKLSETMSKIWIDFANGKEGWEPYGENKRAMIFGNNNETGKLLNEKQDIERFNKYEIWKKIIELNLVEEFGRVCEDICLLRSDDHGYC